MTKQEFMAMSLPYGLKCQVSFRKEILELDLITTDSTFGFKDSRYFKKCTPILRPLSDLTKGIEHEGKKFVPIEILEEDCAPEEIVQLERTTRGINCRFLPFWIVQKLIEWHFAIGIDECDYVDVNTLKTNPYKN